MNKVKNFHKIRVIVKHKKYPTIGITLPKEFEYLLGAFVHIKKGDGNVLILESGALPVALNTKEIKISSKKGEIVRI